VLFGLQASELIAQVAILFFLHRDKYETPAKKERERGRHTKAATAASDDD
jgi:hypothetical protein